MARDPDPSIKLTTSRGLTRTLDDWTTMFHLCLVVLPARPEAAIYLPVAEKIFSVFGDADCRTVYVVTGNEFMARGVLGEQEDRYLAFCDPEAELVQSMGLTHVPAFVHLRQNATLAAAAVGWDPATWQEVARELGTSLAWSYPDLFLGHFPAPSPGWPV